MDLGPGFWVDRPIEEDEEDEDVRMEAEDEEEDIRYENQNALLPASLCPPGHKWGSWSRFVLMDNTAYFAERSNATTASCQLSDGKGCLHITFFTAAPPQVSYFCLDYSGGLKLSHFAMEPQVLAYEGGLALLRVPLGDESDSLEPQISEYFVYHAGILGHSASLTQLPHPSPYYLLDNHVSIVRHCPNRHRERGLTLRPHGASGGGYHDCSQCGYTIVSLCRPHTQQSYQYQLVRLRSDTMAWSCQNIVTGKATAGSHSYANSTIHIEGKKGTVGWVDLWQGIVFCDVLADDVQRTLRYVPLPPPLDGLCGGDPRACRDIAVVDGFIKFVDLQLRVVPGSSTYEGGFTLDGWSATIWRMKTSGSLSWKWKLDRKIDSSELCVSLPKLKVDAGTAQPTLQTLHIGQPTLSLEDDGIVYFLTKIDHRDDEGSGWVIAVDTGKNMVQGVAEISVARTLGFGLVYSATRISEYLHVTTGAKATQKRLGVPLPGSPAKKQHGVHTRPM